jgi:tetratricopeptide (TPR) repeat protein
MIAVKPLPSMTAASGNIAQPDQQLATIPNPPLCFTASGASEGVPHLGWPAPGKKHLPGRFATVQRETWAGMGLKLRNVLAKAATRAGIRSRHAEQAKALVRQGVECLAANRLDEALAVAEKLRHLDPYESWLLKGQATIRLRPHDDLTEFWRSASAEVPRSGGFMRRYLDSALSAGRIEEAEAAMARLTGSGKVHAPDADYAIGLANLCLAAGNTEGARENISRFIAAMRGRSDHAAAELRLSRMLSLLFPEQQIGHPREQILARLRAAAIPQSAAQVIERSAELENLLDQEARQCLFDTDVSRAQCEGFVALVRERLAHGTPFSFIRLGDGESNALGYPAPLTDFFEKDAAERETIWWGASLSREPRALLAHHVAAAIHGADALGIPTLARILRDVRLDVPQELSATRAGRGIVAVMDALTQPTHFCAYAEGILTSAHLHQDLERRRLYPALLMPGDEAVVVSCHPRLAQLLRERFGLNVVRHILIPPRHHSRDAFEVNDLSGAMPGHLDRVLVEMEDAPKGRLVLVGAGYAGKIVIAETKRRGGIALDLGSIFDHWMGARTRSYQDIA